MAIFTPGGGITSNSGGAPAPIDVSGTGLVKSDPVILNVLVVSESVETAIPLPSDCVCFLLQSRLAKKLLLSYVSGESGSVYLTIRAGVVYSESELVPQSRTLYVQTTVPNDTIEVVYWTNP